MKLKKVAALCAKAKCYHLYDDIDGGGALTQWLGDGAAMYRLEGMPVLTDGSLCAVFDIGEKQLKNTIVMQTEVPAGVDVGDTDPQERMLADSSLSVVSGGRELQPLRTSRGIVFIQRKYLDPLENVLDDVRLFERRTPSGTTYIAAKVGLLTAAVIFPCDAVNEKFVSHLEALASECRRALDGER